MEGGFGYVPQLEYPDKGLFFHISEQLSGKL